MCATNGGIWKVGTHTLWHIGFVINANAKTNFLSWGDCTLKLKLPVVNVKLSGLSPKQFTSLQKSYPNFATGTEAIQQTLECHTYQLRRGSAISASDLTRDGQYSPRSCRLPNAIGIVLTGINFSANIILEAGMPSSLGVEQEQELAYPNVIENFLRVLVAHLALQRGGAILHSAGLVFDGRAYIFQGYSNAGKTTLTRKAYDKGAVVLSDDINLLLPDGEGFRAHAVPFTGEFGRTVEHRTGYGSYPVAGIILLEQGGCLKTERVGTSQAVSRLLTGCPFVNTDGEESEALFDSVTALVEKVPVIRLTNRRNDNIDDIMSQVIQALESTNKEATTTKIGSI